MAFTRFHLGTAVPAASTADGVMDALADLFVVAADVDTSAAVSGVLTWTRDTTAGSQAIYSSVFGPRDARIIIAIHDSGSPASGPNMDIDTYAAARILIGICYNASGAYTNWYDATAPFSGGFFEGYNLLCDMTSVASIRAILSAKDLWLQVVNSTGVQTAHVGAVLRGVTGFEESDGYRYGLVVSGVGDMVATFRSATNLTAGHFGRHGTSTGNCHFSIIELAASTTVRCLTGHVAYASPGVDHFKFGASNAAMVPLMVQRETAPIYVLGSWLDVYESAAGLSGQNVGPTTHVRIGASVVTTSEHAVLVKRAVS